MWISASNHTQSCGYQNPPSYEALGQTLFCMIEREFSFLLYCFLSCLIFLHFSFSDSLTFICAETSNNVSLSLCPFRNFRNALCLTCLPFVLENHLSCCLQCIEQGFSHIHVLLKMQYFAVFDLCLTETAFF